MTVSLTGFMGCGKSSVGKVLSQLTGCPIIDTDSWIEQHEGRSIKEIFTEGGEPEFRKMEVNALKTLLPDSTGSSRGNIDLILSLGGGTVTTPEAAAYVRERTFCVYLRAGIDTLVENLSMYPGDRPMLGHPDGKDALRHRIEELISRRSRIYEKTASIIFDIDGMDCRQAAERLLGLIVR